MFHANGLCAGCHGGLRAFGLVTKPEVPYVRLSAAVRVGPLQQGTTLA